MRRGHVRARMRECDTRPESPDDLQPVHIPACRPIIARPPIRQADGYPHVATLELDAGEPLRRDTDDRVGHTAHDDRASEHLAVARKGALPVALVQHKDVLTPRWMILIGAEEAAHEWSDAQQREEIPRH